MNMCKTFIMQLLFFAACDEKKKDGFVRVIVGIKDLTTSTEIIRQGFLPKTRKKAANAKLDVTFENQYVPQNCFRI